jgi:predicted murein hydrolase (TIGR00659 family)
MSEFLSSSVFMGVFVSLAFFWLGAILRRRFHWAVFNPLLLSIVFTILFLKLTGVSYKDYSDGSRYISYLLTPATVCLAVPLYEQIKLLQKNFLAVFLGISSGIVAGLFTVLILCRVFGLDHASYVTLLPKSVTTAIGISISEELGGYVSITVAAIIATGILGNILAEHICRLFRIKNPVARGIAIGTAAHAMGTAKAMEMGAVEGAMSSLSLVAAGMLTVVAASLFAGLL